MYEEFNFSTTSPTLTVNCLSDGSHPSRCAVILHCDFDLHFPLVANNIGHIFCVLIGDFYVLSEEIAIQIHWLFLS
jgi:hypothetical protein